MRSGAAGRDQVLPSDPQHVIERRDLSANTPLHVTVAGLVGLFYGMPLALPSANPQCITSAYLHQLHLKWDGVRKVSGLQDSP